MRRHPPGAVVDRLREERKMPGTLETIAGILGGCRRHGRGRRSLRFAAAGAVALGIPAVAGAAAVPWTGATDTNWATGTNWTGGTPPADDLTTDVASFNSGFTNQPNAGTRQVAGLSVGASRTTSFTITSATTTPGLSIGGSGIDMSAAPAITLTLGAAATNQFTVAAAQSWNVSSAAQLTVAGTLAINNLITLNGAGNTRFSAANTGAGGITTNS